MSEEAIMKALANCVENEQKKAKEEPKLATKQIETPPRKRTINWKSIEENIKKYDGLSKDEQKEADKTWGRTIPFWRRALAYHNQGLSDSQAIEKARGI